MPASPSLPHKFLGLIKLDTLFPRLPGDLGLGSSWGAHVKEVVIHGAMPQLIVQQQESFEQSAFAPAFGQAVQSLAQEGASAITTSCGFLVLWQRDLQSLTSVPVITSSLCLLPELLLSEEQVGVLSIDVNSLTPRHWQGAGVSEAQLNRLVVGGLSTDSHFYQSILGNRVQMNAQIALREVVAAALQMKLSAPYVQTLVLECTNLPPYQAAIQDATGLKVLSLRDVPVLMSAANE